jgi:alkylation response protein AidB-like acyl-CoA dehydrogenase
MSSPAQALVQRASALVPMLRKNALGAETARRVPDANFEALSDAGIFRMTAPKRYGGDEADFQTQCDVLAEIGRGCPSTSWVATIFSAMSWLVSVFPDEAQEEVFADRDPRISGVFSPTGTAVRKDGGLVVSGRWPFNTGCHGAQWTVLNAVLATNAGAGVPTCVLVRSRELKIVDDWHASGMAATGSNTIVAENVFVPAYRSLPLPEMIEAHYPARHNADNPFFNYPTAAVLTVNAGGTPLGIARGALEAFFERLPGRGITYTTYTNKAEAPVTHLQLGEASLKIESADAHVRRAAALLDDHSGGPMSTEARVKARAHISYATGLAREAVDTLFFASGASSIQSEVPIQRFQRDIQALANHAIMHPQTTIELYGRILCGQPPNTLLY